MTLVLRAPDAALEAAFTAMAEEFRAAGEHRFVDEDVLLREGFAAYVAWLGAGARGDIPGYAPWQALWAFDERGELVGMSSLRDPLTPWMAEFGGHIGYRVRPSARRRGFGSAILRLTLARAAERGIDWATIVCEPGNAGSIGVLRANGAVFERIVVADGMPLNRYRVRTSA